MKNRILWIIPLLASWAVLAQVDCGLSEQNTHQEASDRPLRCSSDLWNTDMAVDMACTISYLMIQTDMVNMGCTAAGCHNVTATNKLRIDVTNGKLLDNYNSLFTSQLVVKGDPDQSTLITVPVTGTTATGRHVKTLSGARLAKWRSWVTMGAPY